jgi:tetratricopeptide (TPR) repeat protein
MQPAIDTWKKAIQFDPKFAPAYFNMGTALEALENFGEAMDAYVRAVSINPKMADAYYRMGLLEKKLNHPAQCKVLLQHAVTMEPEAEWARDARKQIELLMEKWAKDPTSTDFTSEVHRVSKSSPSLAEKGNSSESSKDSDSASTDTNNSTNSSNSGNSGATTGDAGSAKSTVKDKEEGEKKRRSPFKRKIRPSNDEERTKGSGTEMKMFIKAPEETDLQAKPQ